MVNLMK